VNSGPNSVENEGEIEEIRSFKKYLRLIIKLKNVLNLGHFKTLKGVNLINS
jgi:hypothetical protein